jgi:hypothetical protein
MTTCAVAFKASPGFFDIDLVATSLSRPKEAMFISLVFKGFRMRSALFAGRAADRQRLVG